MASYKVKIEGDLLEQAKKCTEAIGYSTVDEFVLHVLEKEVKRIFPEGDVAESKEKITKRLQGLGYIE